jgi:hypothetical protein
VTVHIYKIRLPGKIETSIPHTCDEFIYDEVIPKKYRIVAACERALKKVAIDHFLFRRMYADSPVTKTPSKTAKGPSPLELGDDSQVPLKNKQVRKIGNTCPKKRRPDENDVCPAGQEARPNKKGDMCCYKIKIKKPPRDKTKECPSGRTPP